MGLRKSIANGTAAVVRLFAIGLILYSGRLGMQPDPQYYPLAVTVTGMVLFFVAGGVQRWLQRLLFVES